MGFTTTIDTFPVLDSSDTRYYYYLFIFLFSVSHNGVSTTLGKLKIQSYPHKATRAKVFNIPMGRNIDMGSILCK